MAAPIPSCWALRRHTLKLLRAWRAGRRCHVCAVGPAEAYPRLARGQRGADGAAEEACADASGDEGRKQRRWDDASAVSSVRRAIFFYPARVMSSCGLKEVVTPGCRAQEDVMRAVEVVTQAHAGTEDLTLADDARMPNWTG